MFRVGLYGLGVHKDIGGGRERSIARGICRDLQGHSRICEDI